MGTLAYSTGSCVGTRLSHVTRTTTFRPSVSPLPLISRLTRRRVLLEEDRESRRSRRPRNSRTRPGQRKPRTPPTDASHADGRVGGGRRPAAHAAAGPARSVRGSKAASVGNAHAPGGEATMPGRGAWNQDGGARRVETIAPSSPPPVQLGCRPTSPCKMLPCPSGRRWRRRRHRTCVHRRARWRAPPWGTQRRTRHRRKTTVSSTSSLCRRRRRLLRGCQAAGRGIRRRLRRATRFVGAFAAAPAEHARALSAIDPCCRHELAQLGSMSAAPP
jgi:hypothetical protein